MQRQDIQKSWPRFSEPPSDLHRLKYSPGGGRLADSRFRGNDGWFVPKDEKTGERGAFITQDQPR